MDTTSQDIPVETFIDDKGRPYKIYIKKNGFYGIIAEGQGAQPALAEEGFTGYARAKKALETYLMQNDRVGFADYPSKPRDKVRQRVQPKNASRNTE